MTRSVSFVEAVGILAQEAKLQPLSQCMTNIKTNKSGASTITIKTELMVADDLVLQPDGTLQHQGDMLGFVLWLPREKYQALGG